MSIDLSQFHQVFFEESFEGLDVMEQELLGLSPENTDPENINTIFRAAHSIKGGSATFKFDQIAEFTHILETLLDEMRNGERSVTTEAVDLLLQSVDCLREMLTVLQAGGELDVSTYQNIAKQLEQMVRMESENNEGAAVDDEVVSESIADTTKDSSDDLSWYIHFVPEPQILRTGNEPFRMFRELELLGQIDVISDVSKIPSLSEIEEDACYTSWHIFLHADADKLLIHEAFEWVADECFLDIKQMPASDLSNLYDSLAQSLNSISESRDKPSFDSNEIESQPQENIQETAQSEVIVEEVSEHLAHSATETSDPSAVLTEGRLLQVPQTSQIQTQEKPSTKPVAAGGGSIRVSIDKVDSLINLVGELVITQSMLGQLGENFNVSRLERLKEGLTQLEQNTRELQESVMQIRMLPISFVFNRFPRMIRDLSSKLNKKVELEIKGENTELDKTVMEQIGDPMVHLVRNSIDHGIELPEARQAAGKSEVGKVSLNAFHQGGSIVIEITDDGAGINVDKVRSKAIERGLTTEDMNLPDEQIYQLVFEPGFSTADQISDVSGRGVGMDVVKKNITSLGGSVEVISEPGVGSTFTIRLPLTLAILDGQLVRVGDQIYIVPLTSIIESLQINANDIVSVAGNMEVFKLRDDHVPVMRLYQSFDIRPEFHDYDNTTIVVVEGGGSKIGIMVDELLAQQQVVIKSLESNFVSILGISGATILGDGKVALILDVAGMIKRNYRVSKKSKVAAA